MEMLALSLAFAHIPHIVHNQIRLKLKETPLIHQTRRSASTYADALELLETYVPHLVALQRFVSQRRRRAEDQPEASQDRLPLVSALDRLAPFPPLFIGFDSIDLRSDRLAGRECHVEYSVRVDLALTLFAIAQLHALYAEAHVEQATRLQNDTMLEIGERAWEDAATRFARAGAVASAAFELFSAKGSAQLGSILHLFSVLAAHARVLRCVCAVHSTSVRIHCVRRDALDTASSA